MNKILFTYDRNSASAELTRKCYEYWREYCKADTDIVYKKEIEVSAQDLATCDVFVMIRGVSPLSAALCKKAKKLNKFCILHLDDDLLNPPSDYPMLKARKKALLYNVKNSEVIVTNPGIKEKCEKLCDTHRCILLDTAVDGEKIYLHHDDNDCVKIVYPASADHASLFERYVVPVISDVVNACPDKISFTCIGNSPDTSAVDDKIAVKKVAGMSMDKYEEFLQKENYDIGLAPIDDDEFCHGKYFNKYIDYAKFGIVGLFTNCMPYTYIINDGHNGLLCSPTADSWKSRLIEIINDKKLRDNIRQNAYEQLRTQFNVSSIISVFDANIPELRGYVSPKTSKAEGLFFSKLRYKLFRFREMIYLFAFNLTKKGFRSTMSRVSKHFKAAKEYGELSNGK